MAFLVLVHCQANTDIQLLYALYEDNTSIKVQVIDDHLKMKTVAI